MITKKKHIKKKRTMKVVPLLEEEGGNGSSEKLAQAFLKLERIANNYSINQEPLVRMLILAVLAREHAILVGPWGCNKTALINSVLHLLGEKPFCATLDKFTAPEALLGMYSPKLLKEKDIWVRNMQGMLPTARFAFIGEVFRGNGAVRAALHTVMNERYVDNGGQHVPVDTHTMFFDSNSYPVRDEDQPFYDRIMLRMEVDYLAGNNADKFKGMLGATMFDTTKHQPVLDWDQVQDACDHVRNVKVPDVIFHTLYEIRNNLLAKQIRLSDRRYKHALNVLRANAFLNKRTEVHAADLRVLSNVLWRKPEDTEDVQGVLLAYVGGASATETDEERLEAAQEILTAVKDKIDNDQSTVEDLLSAITAIGNIGEKVADRTKRNRINDMVAELEQAVGAMDDVADA